MLANAFSRGLRAGSINALWKAYSTRTLRSGTPRLVSSSPMRLISSALPESTAERGLLIAPMATRPARLETMACNSPTGKATESMVPRPRQIDMDLAR